MARVTPGRRRSLQAAYREGFRAGSAGKPRDACPYGNCAARTHWLAGWVDSLNA